MLKGLSKLAITHGLIPIVYAIVRLYFCLIRIRVIDEHVLTQHLHQGGKAIAAVLHQRICLALTYARRFAEFAPSVMISESRDGEIIAEVVRQLSYRPVRGSSSHGGRKALAAMVADLAEHSFAAHAVDGPRGPRGVIKAGLITMARLSGAPIAPVVISVSRAWVLKSWDRLLIPKPFSTIFVHWGELIYVPGVLDNNEFEAVRLNVGTTMREMHENADRKCGWMESLL